jgi:hypothetical protein
MKITILTFILLNSLNALGGEMENISDTIAINEVKGVFVQAEKMALKNSTIGVSKIKIKNEYSCAHYSKRLSEWTKTRGQRSYLLKSNNLNLKNINEIMNYWNEVLGLGDNVEYEPVNWSWDIKSNQSELENSLMIISYGVETGNNFFSDFIFVDPRSSVIFENNRLTVLMPLSLMDICSDTRFMLLAIKNCKISNIEQIKKCDIKQTELFVGYLGNLKNKLNKTKQKRSRYQDGIGHWL